MTGTNAPDWFEAEKAYRAGMVSVVVIAQQCGMSEGAIRKRAKKLGWERDLTDKVRSLTKSKLVRTVRGPEDSYRTDTQIIEDASKLGVTKVLAQRVSIGRWMSVSQKLLTFLEALDVNEDNHAEYARSLNTGVTAEMNLIKAERQAYGIDDASSEESYESRLARLFEGAKA
jgi:hypothetical protein